MLHQKNKESLQDKQLKDKNRAVAKRENEREMLRKKQQNMQVNSYEPETEMVEAVSPADANKEKMLQKKQLMLNRQKLQLQTKAVNSGQKTDMSMRKESLTLSNFLEGKSKKKKNPDVEIMPEVDSEKGVKESADCPVCGCDPCQCLEGTIAERTRYAKETGKDFKTGNPSEKGGKEPSPAMKSTKDFMRKTGGAMSSRGKAIAIRGKKKDKGAKPKFKTAPTPVDKIKGQLAKKRAPKPDIGSRFD
ncbi:hypothetical protein SBM3_00119 [Synechococcus phage S-BM3]|nr:hypothetical protein SBM3_00119 [Synechococcus phage S-BM3]